MPPRGVSKGSKRARQYEHIRDSLEERGTSEGRAEEIAARTVNKERARHGEARTSSRLSREGISTWVSPPASLCIAAVMPVTGRMMPRPTA